MLRVIQPFHSKQNWYFLVNCFFLPFEKESTLKGKNLLSQSQGEQMVRVNLFLLKYQAEPFTEGV